MDPTIPVQADRFRWQWNSERRALVAEQDAGVRVRVSRGLAIVEVEPDQADQMMPWIGRPGERRVRFNDVAEAIAFACSVIERRQWSRA